MRRSSLGLLAAMVMSTDDGGCGGNPTPTPPPTHDAAIEAAVTSATQPIIGKPTTVGLVVEVLKGNTEDYYFFGTKDQVSPPDGRTLFAIASITKTFTATLLADQTLTAGVHLSDSVNLYLPAANQVTGQKAGITLEMLAEYSSGLQRDIANHGTNASLFADFDSTTLTYAPGTSSAYSNFGFSLLGRLLEAHAGKDWETLVQTRVIKRLNMNDTMIMTDRSGAVVMPGEQQGRLAKGYRCTASSCSVPGPTVLGEMNPCGALYSTPADMMVWLKFNMGKLTSEMNPLLPIVHSPSAGKALAWGDQDAGTVNEQQFKSGVVNGFNSFIGFERDVGVVVLTNSEQVDPKGIGQTILQGLVAP